MPLVPLTDGWAVVVDCIVWAVWSTGVGYVMHRRPVSAFDHDTFWTRLRPFEADGRFWERTVRIKRWKHRLPEAGDFFDGGFDKKRLHGDDPAALERFVVETRRAEVTHWVVLAAAPAFVLWNPWWLALVMATFAVVANVPCLITQRYNRARLVRILARRARRSA